MCNIQHELKRWHVTTKSDTNDKH